MVEAIVPGVGGVPVNPHETIPKELLKKYVDLMEDVQAIFNRTPLDENDATELQDLLQKLAKLAKEGYQANDGYTYYLSQSMLQQMKPVFSMLESAGITPSSTIDKSFLDAMKFLQEYKYEGVDNQGKKITFKFAELLNISGLANESKNLEDMIKTDLLDYGTKMFDKKLDELLKTLEITKATLDVLKALQDILNQVDTPNPANFKFPPESIKDIPEDLMKIIAARMGTHYNEKDKIWDGPGDKFKQAYEKAIEAGNKGDEYGLNTKSKEAMDLLNKWLGEGDNASKYIDDAKDYFKQIIAPEPYLKTDTVKDLLAYREELRTLLAKLKAMDPQGMAKEGSLASSVEKVLESLDAAFKTFDSEQEQYPNGDINNPNNTLYIESHKAALAWILDGRDKVGGTAGNNQDLLGKAINAGENLNDEAKDEFQQVKSTYDNFMKMASALIEALKKIIERFGQGIAR